MRELESCKSKFTWPRTVPAVLLTLHDSGLATIWSCMHRAASLARNAPKSGMRQRRQCQRQRDIREHLIAHITCAWPNHLMLMPGFIRRGAGTVAAGTASDRLTADSWPLLSRLLKFVDQSLSNILKRCNLQCPAKRWKRVHPRHHEIWSSAG